MLSSIQQSNSARLSSLCDAQFDLKSKSAFYQLSDFCDAQFDSGRTQLGFSTLDAARLSRNQLSILL
jgi:hypothetical protein